jgi:hypothetical protein
LPSLKAEVAVKPKQEEKMSAGIAAIMDRRKAIMTNSDDEDDSDDSDADW